MSVVVKYPSHAAHYPDERFCGQCGRYGQPLINDNNGFGPNRAADILVDTGDWDSSI